MWFNTYTFIRHVYFWFNLLIFVNLSLFSQSVLSMLNDFVYNQHMPVITRSMARGGLQTSTSSVPLPFHSLTCNNAITVTSESTEIASSVTESLPLSELVEKSHLLSPVLDIDRPFSSSLDSNFELLEFENSKLSSRSLSFENITTLPLSQFSNMETDCKEESNASLMPKASASSNDEILQVLTAISSQMIVGHQDLQNQLISSNQQLQTGLQRVREDNENFKREMRLESAMLRVSHLHLLLFGLMLEFLWQVYLHRLHQIQVRLTAMVHHLPWNFKLRC
jgi:hypothetical protein